ncbi:MAG: hypothetical protein WA981_13690, partial [Glaciecola sp.]
FLVKATAGAAIASIPAKSVWATGLTNSIVASGHGSDFANGVQIVLLSPNSWKSNGTDLTDTYKSVFHQNPLIGSELRDLIPASALEHITLGAILGKSQYVNSFITAAGGIIVNPYHFPDGEYKGVKFVVNHQDVYIKYRSLKTALKTPYSGASDLNKLIVSTYLNAKYSGVTSGVVYPVVKSPAYPNAPYNSIDEFARKLQASVGHSNTRTLLTDLHNNPNSLATLRY